MSYVLKWVLWVFRCMGLSLALVSIGLPAKGAYISLEEALGRVELDNIQVLLAKEGVEQALQKQMMQRSSLLPQVEAELSQVRQKDTVRGGETKTYNAMEGSLKASVSLFDATLLEAYKAAKLGRKVSHQGYKALLEAIQYAVAKAYYTYVQDMQRSDVLNKNLERDLALLDLAQAQRSAGVASPLDTLRAHARVLKDKQDLLAHGLALKESELALKRLLSLEPEEELTVDKAVLEKYTIPPAIPSAMPPVLAMSPALEAVLEAVWKQRPDYQQALKKLKQAKAELRQAKGGHLPKASFFAATGVNAEKPFDKTEKSSWMVGAKVTLPLFEGFRVSSDVRRAQAALREQRYALEELRQKIEAAYALAKASLEAKGLQLALSKDQVALALEELEMAKDRFKNGIGDNQALLSAQASLAAVEDEALQLLYRYVLAWLDIAFEQGQVKMILNAFVVE